MTKISDLPRDLVEEVLSRVPVTSLRAVRFTCTKWNTLTKHESFTKKQIDQAKAAAEKEEFLAIMTMNSRVYVMSVNLHGIHKDGNVESSIQTKGKLISLKDGNDQVIKYKVLHCNGLLLCITKDRSRLVVWNPYCGQTRWIEPRNSYHCHDNYALGYEMKNKYSLRSDKVLRFVDDYHRNGEQPIHEFEIYSFDSSSWKVIEVTPDWGIWFPKRGVSLKGNTYWPAQDTASEVEEFPPFLVCFDFTTERIGPRLTLILKIL